MRIKKNIIVLICFIMVISIFGSVVVANDMSFSTMDGPATEIWVINESNTGEIKDISDGTTKRDIPYNGTKVMPSKNDEIDLVWNTTSGTVYGYDGNTETEVWNATGPTIADSNRFYWGRNEEIVVLWSVASGGNTGGDQIRAFWVKNGSTVFIRSESTNSVQTGFAVGEKYYAYQASGNSGEIRYIRNDTDVGNNYNFENGPRGDPYIEGEHIYYIYDYFDGDNNHHKIAKEGIKNGTIMDTSENNLQWPISYPVGVYGHKDNNRILAKLDVIYWVNKSTLNNDFNKGDIGDQIWHDNERAIIVNTSNTTIQLYDLSNGDSIASYGYSGVSIAPDLTYKEVTISESIDLQVKTYMVHDSKQKYTVTLETTNLTTGETTTKDVTDETNVTSNNTSIITIDETNNTIISTSDVSVNDIALVTATYTGETSVTDSENVTVANATMENIDILPNTKWMTTFAGVNEPGLEYGLGAEIQWIFFIILMMVTGTYIAQSKWIGLGIGEMLLVYFWIAEFIGLGVFLGSMIFGLFMILTQMNRSSPQINVTQRLERKAESELQKSIERDKEGPF